MTQTIETPLLEMRGVTKLYGGGLLIKPTFTALDQFSLQLYADNPRVTTIAGESGSGKTTLANLVLGFITPTTGNVLYQGKDIAHLSRAEFMHYRREVQAVFQDPYEVYNPFYKVDHIFDTVVSKFKLAKGKIETRTFIEHALEVVGLRPSEVLGKYPHQLSGGQRQRLMVARAFLLKPKLIVADEPVSMVDASLRGMILEIMLNLKKEFGISILYITHDLSTAYQVSDEIFILYRGAVAEAGEIGRVIETPKHPYTQMLIQSIPLPDPDLKWDTQVTLSEEEMGGSFATRGCRFASRCPSVMDVCKQTTPASISLAPNHRVACFLYHNGAGVAK